MAAETAEIRLLAEGDRDSFCSVLDAFLHHAGDDQALSVEQMGRLFAKAIDPAHNYYVIGAFSGGEMVGSLSLTFGESSYRSAPFAWCDDVYVLEQHRGERIGRRLIERAAALAAERGCSSILLGVSQDELSARRFYAACGFIDLDNRLYSLPLRDNDNSNERAR